MNDRRAYWNIVTDRLRRFLHGQLQSAVAVAVLATLVLFLVGVRWPIVLGPLIGGLALIPVLGTGLGLLLGVLVAFAEQGPRAALLCATALVGVQLVDNWIVAPRIQGAGLDVRPFAALLIVLVGGALLAPVLGPFAPLLALPLAVAARDIRRYRQLRVEGVAAEQALESLSLGKAPSTTKAVDSTVN